jgi:hypothetical protein
LNKKIISAVILIFMSLAVALAPFANVLGQNTQLGVSIIQVVPASEANSLVQLASVYNGSAGQPFNVKGTIYTSNGTYNIIMGNAIVASGTAQGYYVNTNFTVPQLPGGDYNFLIEDIKQGNLNSTGSTPEQFLVTPGYTITPASSYNQEDSVVGLTVSITGGNSGLSYAANITVVLPSPLNGNFSDLVTLVANQVGTASAQINFPSSNFQSGDSLQLNAVPPTDFAGTYTLYFNMTQVLASNQFSVGFLDTTIYHRGQTAVIAAKGYTAGQTATFSVTDVATGASLTTPLTLTADASGIISTTWAVPTSAAVGSYKATITTTSGSAKLLPDSQTFSVPGYSVTITTLNLNNQVVPNIFVKAQDQYANTSYNSTSGINGVANFKLEAGPYLLTASLKGVNIGQTNITVSGAGNFNFPCQLVDLLIKVQNENGTAMPFVNLAISYQYGSSQTANVSAQTGVSGTYTLNSTLTGISYTIQASIYGQVFNSDNETLSNLPAQATYQYIIICPTEPLTFNVVGYNNSPISGASIRLVELTNGLFYTATTDTSGAATASLTFGIYNLQIYQNGILLNETTVKAFSAGQYGIRCTLYGIQVDVSVVDYFGSPISNANVTVNGPSSERYSAMTSGNGKAIFSNVIGGNLQIVAFAKGAESSYQAVSLTVDQPTSVQIKMSGYVTLGSLLIPTTALLTLILIVVAIILLVIVEIFMRRRRRVNET